MLLGSRRKDVWLSRRRARVGQLQRQDSAQAGGLWRAWVKINSERKTQITDLRHGLSCGYAALPISNLQVSMSRPVESPRGPHVVFRRERYGLG
jgi:hypothetical protein